MPSRRTDDIAENVADILFDQTTKTLNTFWDVGSNVAMATGAGISSVVDDLIKRFEASKEYKEMLSKTGEVSVAEINEMKKRMKETASSIFVDNADAKEYESLLKDQGVLYAPVDKQDDNVRMFVFLKKDEEKVKNATTILNARHGQISELRPDLYFRQWSPDNVHVVEGLSAAEMELFRHYAREDKFLFTVVKQKDGYMLVSDENDRLKVKKTLSNVGWALTGTRGERVRQQLEYRLKGRSALQIAAEEGERELVIVSGRNPNNFVRITSEDLKIYKQNKEVSTVPRSDPAFYSKCMANCEGLSSPIILEPDQFHEGMTREELQNMPTLEMFPEIYEEHIERNTMNEMQNLIAMKFSLDNEGNAPAELLEPGVSYADFSEFEYITDQEEFEARERDFEHYRQAMSYSTKTHREYSIDMKEKNVDYMIAKAEEKRKTMYGLDREPSRTGSRENQNREEDRF